MGVKAQCHLTLRKVDDDMDGGGECRIVRIPRDRAKFHSAVVVFFFLLRLLSTERTSGTSVVYLMLVLTVLSAFGRTSIHQR